MDPAGLTLYTFAMSHYCEKVRWALQTCQIPFREVVMTPAFHMIPALRMGGRGQTTLPILREGRVNGNNTSVQDSTRILLWLDERHGPLDILPQGAELRDECMSVEDRFDMIGRDVARFLYMGGFRNDAKVLSMWTEHSSPWEAAVMKRLYPVIKWAFKRRLKITAKAAARSEHRIQQTLAWLEGRLSDGRLYLVGSRLTVADITAASLLAPLACPAEHPVYGQADFVRTMRPGSGYWQPDRPAFAWVRRIYQTHRGDHRLAQAA